MNTHFELAALCITVILSCIMLTTIIILWHKINLHKNLEKSYKQQIEDNNEMIINMALYLKIMNLNINILKAREHIDETYVLFLDKLTREYPQLTESERRLYMMLHVNMSSKEIATLTKKTIRGVETARYRLKKKISLTTKDMRPLP